MIVSARFCNACGTAVELRIPEGDHLSRAVCPACGHIQYFNPRVIAGVVAEWQGKILMCRRAIEPRRGFWTFPAGFLELGETHAAGAARETIEEAQAEVGHLQLMAVISVPHVSQIYMVHRGQLRSAHHGPTLESSETRLMDEAEIPWSEIAFPTIFHGLKFFFADRAAGVFPVHTLDLHWPARANATPGIAPPV